MRRDWRRFLDSDATNIRVVQIGKQVSRAAEKQVTDAEKQVTDAEAKDRLRKLKADRKERDK